MSLPTSDSDGPNPAVPAPGPKPEVAQEFDLLAFWIQHQKLVTRLLMATLLAVAIWGAFLYKDYRRRTGSENALANANGAEGYRKVVTEWSGTPAAGTAYVRLAEELRKENKPKEAATALRDFLDKYPLHPLRVPAAHALAASLETAGDLDAALVAYQNFATTHVRSAFAPLGLVGQARVLTALGKPDEARLILASVEQRFPGNPFTQDARTLLEEIKNPAGTKIGGAPRPTPAPTPAPAPNLKPVVTPDPKPVPQIKPGPAAPALPPPPKPPGENPTGAAAQPAPQAPPAVPPAIPATPPAPTAPPK